MELKGLKTLEEIGKATEQCREQQEKLKQGLGKEALEKNAEMYASIIQQTKDIMQHVKEARVSCNSQRPFISEDKIKRLELLLLEIGQF
jgi:hypothetical protein